MSDTLKPWLREAAAALAAAGVASPQVEAQVLAAHAFDTDRTAVVIHGDWFVPNKLHVLLQRRLNREPLAYLVGWREFWGRRFTVGPGVLIPRQETEHLIEATLELRLPKQARVLDVGSGSGAIAVTLAVERPEWSIVAVDRSPTAVAFTKKNAKKLHARIEAVEADLFPPDAAPFDLIVSNPPYVRLTDPLPPEVRDHEPPEALFGGEDGLDVYRRLAADAPARLSPQGWLLVEVGDDQADDVGELLASYGWDVHDPLEDLADIPRVVRAQRP